MNSIACLTVLLALSATPPVWDADLDSALARARKQNRPVFVVFRCDH